MTENTHKTVLILGENGRFGGACAQEFEQNNWHVKKFNRATDNLKAESLGCDLILLGWNPQYPDWAKDVPVMTQKVIAAAKASSARVIIPGNVYVYGPSLDQNINEGTPHQATNSLGLIRKKMEEDFLNSGVKTLIIRAGDYIDTRASGNWFDLVLCKDLKKGKFTYPGPLDREHAFAYLPDLAKAVVGLSEKRDTLADQDEFLFQGFSLTGAELHQYVAPTSKLKSFPWFSLKLARPFWPMAKYLLEMRYLWKTPHSLDGSKLRNVLPNLVETPVEIALARAIKDLT